ncbi:MAG: hypothetical protein IJI49_04440 [Bacilli bacterium]|nr:hypothetical protein [Bacilli bacterium]
MNTVNITDTNFINTEIYKKFMEENPGRGILMIRASAAKEAIPISNLDITVSKIIDNYNVIFFKGKTDNSGMIKNISLPTPAQNINDLTIPQSTTYEISANTEDSSIKQIYTISMYNNICVVQNINITPQMNERRYYYGY